MSGSSINQLVDNWLTVYGPAILRTCAVYLGDRQLAEDALQETYIRAWQALRKLNAPIQNEKAWLMRIAVNVCHDLHRSRWFRHIDAATALDDLPEIPDEQARADHDLLLDVYRLPEKYKQVILLYFYHGLTQQEAADALGVSVSAVSKRLAKAQAMLKTEWEVD